MKNGSPVNDLCKYYSLILRLYKLRLLVPLNVDIIVGWSTLVINLAWHVTARATSVPNTHNDISAQKHLHLKISSPWIEPRRIHSISSHDIAQQYLKTIFVGSSPGRENHYGWANVHFWVPHFEYRNSSRLPAVSISVQPVHLRLCLSSARQGTGCNICRRYHRIRGLIGDNDGSWYRAQVNALVEWCGINNLELKVLKTKDLIVDFRRSQKNEISPERFTAQRWR